MIKRVRVRVRERIRVRVRVRLRGRVHVREKAHATLDSLWDKLNTQSTAATREEAQIQDAFHKHNIFSGCHHGSMFRRSYLNSDDNGRGKETIYSSYQRPKKSLPRYTKTPIV